MRLTRTPSTPVTHDHALGTVKRTQGPEIEARLVQQATVPADVAIKTIVSDLRLRKVAVADEIATAALVSKGGALSRNYLMAEFAKEHVRSMLRHGSNAVPDTKVDDDEAKKLLDRLRDSKFARVSAHAQDGRIGSRTQMMGGKRILIVRRADLARIESDLLREIGYGHCFELGGAAYWFLQQHGVEGSLVELCKTSISRHVLVVIGRRPDSDRGNVSTWGPDAVVCDPWANKVYPLSEFPRMQQPENNVELRFVAKGAHYLQGTLVLEQEEMGL